MTHKSVAQAEASPWDEHAPSNAFERASREYADLRPDYPRASVQAALGSSKPGLKVADIGAGTGKFTRALVELGADVTAVEPAQAMRLQLETTLAEIAQLRVREGTAENTGLESHTFDVVTYAQCWHWLDTEAACAEAVRILKPGGRLAIIFNQIDVSEHWAHRLTRIMRSGDIQRPHKPPRITAAFTEPQLHMVTFTTALTPAQTLGLARTRSSYLKSTPANRERMQNNLRWYLHDHLGYGSSDLIEIPYYTLTWTSALR
ncbi:MAG: class I SAM-dependent methyltransferase [Actinomycetaceae bacterium]|nr:class I SAM-dependent methyltransferase [Actinomycetaceae bacterium]